MFLDTSGLFCLLDADDRRHVRATELYDAATERLTHSVMLSEFVPLCQSRGLNRVDSLSFASDLVDDPDIELVWVDETLTRAGLSFPQSRHDKTYSLCDAISFVLMRHYGITEALTTDHHFSQEGMIRLLEP